MITITSLPYHPKWNVWRYPTTLTDFGDLTTCTGRHPRHHLTQWDFFFWPAHFSKDLGTRKIWKQETHAQEMLGDVKVPRLQASITYAAKQPCKFIWTNESVGIRKELKSFVWYAQAEFTANEPASSVLGPLWCILAACYLSMKPDLPTHFPRFYWHSYSFSPTDVVRSKRECLHKRRV